MLAGEALERRQHGAALLQRGLLVAAGEEFERWLSLVEGSGDSTLIIPALNALATVASHRGEMDKTLQFLKRAQELAEADAASRPDRLRFLLNLMMIYTEMGKLDEALTIAQRLDKLQADEEPGLAPIYWMNMSLLYYRRHEWIPMQHASGEAHEACQAAGLAAGTAKALTNRGIAHLELGDLDQAERDFRSALALRDEVEASDIAYTHVELGRLYFIRGDLQAALAAGREALSALLDSVAIMNKEEVARINKLFGEIFATSGTRNMALKYLNRAAAYYSQLGLRAEWQRATQSIGQALTAPVQAPRRQLFTEQSQLDFLTGVLDMIDDLESVDPYLRGHSERVASLALVLAEEMDLSEEERKTLHLAARLHDVGMVAVDAELLQKEGGLNENERRRVSLHCEIGEEMVRPFGVSPLGLQAIRHHHEHWDGSGYPDGLSGESIPYLARIVAVVDVYDSLTSDRVYRPAMPHKQASSHLRQMAGRELDPSLVDRFLALHDV